MEYSRLCRILHGSCSQRMSVSSRVKCSPGADPARTFWLSQAMTEMPHVAVLAEDYCCRSFVWLLQGCQHTQFCHSWCTFDLRALQKTDHAAPHKHNSIKTRTPSHSKQRPLKQLFERMECGNFDVGETRSSRLKRSNCAVFLRKIGKHGVLRKTR